MRSHQDIVKFLEQDGTVTLKTIAEVEAMCGFTWQENINGEADFSQTSYIQPQQQIAENSAKLVLTRFSDEIGYGIVTDKNNTLIPGDQVICIYEGEEKSLSGDYRLGNANAQERGNIARFVLHLPTNFELLQYEFKAPLTAADVATANINITFLDHEALHPALISNRTIQPGEIIGYSYHDHFWDYRKMQPALFTKTGQIIDPALYAKNPEKRKQLEEVSEPLEKIRGSGWDGDDVDDACSNCKTVAEFNATLANMVLSFSQKTSGREAIFWMGLYLELIVTMLSKIASQLPETQTNLLTAKVKPLKQFIRFFDRTLQEMKMDNIDNLASELESIFKDESLQELQPTLAPAHEMLKQFRH